MVKPGDILTVTAQSMAFGGQAVARVKGFVLFVDGALPEERVRVRVERIRRDHGFARVEAVLTPSPDRIDPPCPAFGRCGGCSFLHWRYAAQCRAKEQWIRNALRRFPDACESLLPIDPSDTAFHFRNRMGFTIASRRPGDVFIGLHERASPDRILPAAGCLLPYQPSRALCEALEGALQHQRSLPRRADLRISLHTGERMVTLHAAKPLPYAEDLAEALRTHCEHLSLSIGPEGPLHRVRRTAHPLVGEGFLVERLRGLDFRIHPDTFFQTHTAQADKLLRHIQDRTDRHAPRRILDLYAGVGAITLTLAAPGRTVWGLEAWKPAVKAARENAALNGRENARFHEASVESVQSDALGFKPELVVIDPPRNGLTPAARRTVLRLSAPTLLYVSCNPATLTRDLDALAEGGYRIASARGFDLFPQTSHVECVVELRRA